MRRYTERFFSAPTMQGLSDNDVRLGFFPLPFVGPPVFRDTPLRFIIAQQM